jgi:Fic/DOC family
MPVEWSGDGTPADHLQVERNLHGLMRDLQRDAPGRSLPTIGMAREWHRRIFDGIAVPVPYYVGGVRDSDPSEPELDGYRVSVPGPVGAIEAVAPSSVWAELGKFEGLARSEALRLDASIPYNPDVRLAPPDDVVVFSASLLGEWLRIHPFVNGNGRTARIWGNWAALRYGLPAFIRLRPRPTGNTYITASERSMYGDHRYMVAELWRMLVAYVEQGEPG